MPPLAPVRLSDGQLRGRLEGLTAYLDRWGDVRPRDVGRSREIRLIEFDFSAPGGGLPVEVQSLYREYYRASAGEWALAKYTYEYLDPGRGQRLAYHLHPIGGRSLVPHAHCEAAAQIPEDERSEHLRAFEYDLREAHHEFMRLWMEGLAPDCSTFLPLVVPRAEPAA